MATANISISDTEIIYQNCIVNIVDKHLHITWQESDKMGVLVLDPVSLDLTDGEGIKVGQIASMFFDDVSFCKVLLEKPARKKYEDIFTAGISCVVYSPEISDISNLMIDTGSVGMSISGMRATDNKWLHDTELEIDLINSEVTVDESNIGKFKTVMII